MIRITRQDVPPQGIVILKISGRLTFGLGTSELREATDALLKEGVRRIILDLGDISHVDPSGIVELVSGYTKIAENGGVLKLARVSKKIAYWLHTSRLDKSLGTHIYPDENEAIASFTTIRS